MKGQPDFDELMALHFSGSSTKAEEEALSDWKEASEENLSAYKNAEKTWQSLSLLQEMRSYNMPRALAKFHGETGQSTSLNRKGFLFYWQRVAAILILPVLIGGGIYFAQTKHITDNSVVWQTIVTPPGVKSQAQLPDGTKVWLNSASSLSYPSSFSDGKRNVKLLGEAFFDVAKDEKHPFVVDLGKINIEVVGTTFNATNYEHEGRTEVVLASGKVKLFEKNVNENRLVSEMKPGQQAIFHKAGNTMTLNTVETGKYTSWIDGKLIFRDDPMYEVVRKLNRWFNVQIEFADPDIGDYIYTATFRDETIEQVLSLIKRTSPIEYAIVPGERLNDGSYATSRITITKKTE